VTIGFDVKFGAAVVARSWSGTQMHAKPPASVKF